MARRLGRLGGEAMQRDWKRGDIVVVTTVNKGLPARPGRKYPAHDNVEKWPGKIVGPSLIGPGWWNVRRITPKGRGGSAYAVPHGEIKRSRRA